LACGQYTGGGEPEESLPAVRHNSSARRHACAAPAHLALLECAPSHPNQESEMKAVIDFSYAALVAAVIGIAIGGSAFSLVWLMHILKI